MSKSLNIAAIVLAMTFASGYFDEPLTVSGMTPGGAGESHWQPEGCGIDSADRNHFRSDLGLRPGDVCRPIRKRRRLGGSDWHHTERPGGNHRPLHISVLERLRRNHTDFNDPQPDLPQRDDCRPGHRNRGDWIRTGTREECFDQACGGMADPAAPADAGYSLM